MNSLSFMAIAILMSFHFAETSAADQLSDLRNQYVSALVDSLKRGFEFPDKECTELQPGAKTVLLKEISVPTVSGKVNVGNCEISIAQPGPIVIPAQTLTYIGCKDASNRIDVANEFNHLHNNKGLYFRTEDDQVVLARCSPTWKDYWPGGLGENRVFSKLRIFPKVLGQPEKKADKKTPFDG